MDSSLAESINAQVLTMTTSASSALAVTCIPCATISPSMISASTRFFAHPRLIIPTFTLGDGGKTSAADKGRLVDSIKPIRSINHYITGVTRDKLPVLSHLDSPFVQDMDPESFSLHNNRPTVRPGESVKHGLSPLLILGDLDVSPSDYPNLQLPRRRVRRGYGLRRHRWQRPPHFDPAFGARRGRIRCRFLLLDRCWRGDRGALRRRLGRQ